MRSAAGFASLGRFAWRGASIVTAPGLDALPPWRDLLLVYRRLEARGEMGVEIRHFH